MSKSCKDCEHFEGFDDVGMPYCNYGDGAEDCPYNDEGETEVSKSNIVIKIEQSDLNDRICNTFANSINSMVNSAITRLVEKEYGEKIRQATVEAMQIKISEQVSAFMEQPIQIGGGWREEARTLTRNEFLAETIQKSLNEKFDQEKLAKTITESVKSEAEKFANSTKNEINRKVKEIFDGAMKQNLTDSIVAMLMDNETYKRLSGSMQTLIGNANAN